LNFSSLTHITPRYVWVAYQYFRKNPARSLGTVAAPDEASAVAKAIDFFCIEPALQFHVVAVRLAAKPAKEGAR
jgi:hypothetical protein